MFSSVLLFSLSVHRKELQYFNEMTTKVVDPTKRNACIMGRNTYLSMPPQFRPLPQRLNVVLTRTGKDGEFGQDVVVCANLSEAMSVLHERYANEVENVWIAGGSSVYKEAMASELCHRVYLTEIKAQFECDTFFPEISSDFVLVENDGGVPSEEQDQYRIYEKSS